VTHTAPTRDVLGLTIDQIDALAAGFGDAAAIDVLRRAQLDRLLQALESIKETASPDATHAAFELLERAAAANGHAYIDALSYPYIHTWAWTTYRALMDGNATQATEHTNHIRNVAASVAFRCGTDFAITITPYSRCVTLPGVGQLRLHDDVDSVTVRSSGHQLTFSWNSGHLTPSENAFTHDAEWLELRHVRAEGSIALLSVVIDDLDPYRGTYSMAESVKPAERLSDAEVKDVKERIFDGWTLLTCRMADYVPSIAAGVSVVTPMVVDNRSLHDRPIEGFGAIAIANTSHQWMAYAFVEEFQRAKIAALHYVYPLHDVMHDEPFGLAPWNALVPVSYQQFLETTYASRCAATFWRAEIENAVDEVTRVNAAMSLAFSTLRLPTCTRQLNEPGYLTPLGATFVARMSELGSLDDVGIEPELLERVRITEQDLLLSLRLSCLVPDQGSITSLLADWHAQRPPTMSDVPSVLCGHSTLTGWRTRRWLAQLTLAEPARFADIVASETYLQMLDEHADVLDARLAAGHVAAVRDACCARIADGSATLEDWSRLAAACIAEDQAGASVMTQRPELVHSLCVAMSSESAAAIDPMTIAEWLSPLVSAG
jgi:HEXXH motif-containing protein